MIHVYVCANIIHLGVSNSYFAIMWVVEQLPSWTYSLEDGKYDMSESLKLVAGSIFPVI